MADDPAAAPQDGDTSSNVEPQDEQSGNADSPRRSGAELDREQLQKALAKARDEAAKYRQKAKFAFPDEESYQRAGEALAKLHEAEEAKRSEVEKLTERNEQLLYRSAESEKQLARLRVALGAGIGADRADEFASRLRGDTEDELKADAEQLRVLFQPAAPERRADPSQGAGRSEQGPSGNSLQSALESKLGISR